MFAQTSEERNRPSSRDQEREGQSGVRVFNLNFRNPPLELTKSKPLTGYFIFFVHSFIHSFIHSIVRFFLLDVVTGPLFGPYMIGMPKQRRANERRIIMSMGGHDLPSDWTVNQCIALFAADVAPGDTYPMHFRPYLATEDPENSSDESAAGACAAAAAVVTSSPQRAVAAALAAMSAKAGASVSELTLVAAVVESLVTALDSNLPVCLF
jgi:hypothetical protein